MIIFLPHSLVLTFLNLFLDDIDSNEFDYDENDEGDEEEKIDFEIGSRIFMSTFEDKQNAHKKENCEGALKLYHTSKIFQNNFKEITKLEKYSKYPDVQRGLLKNQIILRIESVGNCCWNVFEKRIFRGRKVKIEKGFNDSFNNFPPGSFEKVDCEE